MLYSDMSCDKTKCAIAVLGYGSQGRAFALNLRDSGYDVMVGLRPRSANRSRAKGDGLKQVTTLPKAVRQADCVCFAFPDFRHGQVYRESIEPFIKSGVTLLFLQGMSIHFGYVVPPPDADVILIAPHAPGAAVRERFQTDRSISAFYAIRQDSSKRALNTTLELAQAVGFKKKRLMKTTFEHEAVGDLFGEQVVLCGGLAALIKNGFEVLVENGLPPENAYLEVAYQLDLIVDLIKKYGVEGMLNRISVTARYGSIEAGPKIVNESTRNRMRQVFRRIQSGKFTERLNRLTDNEIEKLAESLKTLSNPELEKAARKFGV